MIFFLFLQNKNPFFFEKKGVNNQEISSSVGLGIIYVSDNSHNLNNVSLCGYQDITLKVIYKKG